ncbi:hypothetical protein PGTUg99_024957 [Puccinia graminis f. sp. tritici]|uniref:Uncharacterized protein n=1 Tax=Puccinia graminis f. sp. tritici TaxID=56615 RepID=A0A5B0R6E8_PUCGR|nr:hypothetical protein PGTUg99_024957 [Puccinia graminis f. sp. tritici]
MTILFVAVPSRGSKLFTIRTPNEPTSTTLLYIDNPEHASPTCLDILILIRSIGRRFLLGRQLHFTS